MTGSELAKVIAALRRQFLLTESDLAAGAVTESTRSNTLGYSIFVSIYGNEIELWAPSDLSPAEIAGYVADELQGLVLDDVWGEPRPVCPGHSHPAWVKVEDGAAWWTCPTTGRPLEVIWPTP